jgi:hypothetical protein
VVFAVVAANVGAWGDTLELSVERDQAWTELGRMRAAAALVREVDLDSSLDLFEGASVRWQTPSAGAVEAQVEAVVGPGRMRLTAPLGSPVPEGTALFGRLLNVGVAVAEQVESFAAVSLNPAHPRFIERVINGELGDVAWLDRTAQGLSVLVRVSAGLVASTAPLPGVDVAMSAPLLELPTGLTLPAKLSDRIAFDPTAGELVFSGVMTRAERDLLASLSADASYAGAIDSLFAATQVSHRTVQGLDPVLPIDSRLLVGYDGVAYFPFADPYTSGFWGLASLERIEEVSLVSVPELSNITPGPTRADDYVRAQQRMLDHCAAQGERFALLEPPEWLPATRGVAAELEEYQWRLKSTGPLDFGAVYFPWVEAQTGRLPPSSSVAGLYSRTDESDGTHRAPANETLSDATGLSQPIDDALHATLRQWNVNCLRVLPGRGVVVWGAQTLSDDVALKQISVRRTLLLIRRELSRALTWAVFEPNTRELERAIGAALRSYLLGLFRAGVLAGTTAAEAFAVERDDAEQQLTFRIGLALVRPAEFILVRVRRGSSGVVVSA